MKKNLSAETFASDIERICSIKGIKPLDAVLLWCEKNKVEVETAASWIVKNPSLKAKATQEAIEMNLLKK